MGESLQGLPSQAATSQIVSRKDRADLVKAVLEANAPRIAAVLGKSMTPEKFAGVVIGLLREDENLLKCSPASIVMSAMRCAQLGFSPDRALGQCWLIPRKGKAEFQLGYRGLIALAYRSPLVAAVRYGVVAQGEEFTWRDGRNWQLDHVPGEDGWPANAEQTRAAWCVIDLRTGGQLPRVMGRAEIIRHRQAGGGSGPAWRDNFAAMAVKTVIADACRRAPLETEVGRAIEIDRMGDAGEGQPGGEILDVEHVETTGGKVSAFKRAFSSAPQTAQESASDPNDGGEPEGHPDDEDPFGGALDDRQAGEDDEQPEPAPVLPHVRKVIDAAAKLGLTPEQASSQIGGNVFDIPKGAEGEAIGKLHRA